MTITITTITETGKKVCSFVFTNSIDANKERDLLESAGVDYVVQYDCK